MGLWRNGSASDSRSEGWELESLWPQTAVHMPGLRLQGKLRTQRCIGRCGISVAERGRSPCLPGVAGFGFGPLAITRGTLQPCWPPSRVWHIRGVRPGRAPSPARKARTRTPTWPPPAAGDAEGDPGSTTHGAPWVRGRGHLLQLRRAAAAPPPREGRRGPDSCRDLRPPRAAIAGIKQRSNFAHWGYGATAARLTPDQKLGSSNLSGLRQLCTCQG